MVQNLKHLVISFLGVTAGHYTAYTQHLQTSEWHYFNDASFNKQKPQEEDFSNAYVLFYKKQGNVSFVNYPLLSKLKITKFSFTPFNSLT